MSVLIFDSIDDIGIHVRGLRMAIRRFAEDAPGLCSLSESHIDAALAQLDGAQANIELASLHQAHALASVR